MPKYSTILERTAYAAILLAATLEFMSPFLIHYLGYDGFHALMWITAFPAILSHGVWYPHWLNYAYGGLGSSTFYFYPPLAYFVITPLQLFFSGMTDITVFHIAGFAMTLASLLSMRYLLRIVQAERWLAWLGSLLYAYAPYHFDVLYVRSGPAEHLAFVWAPLVFAGLILLLRDRNPTRGFILLAVSWGLLLVSHVPAAVTIGIAAIVITLASIRRLTWPRFGIMTLAAVLGTALAAFYFLPVAYFAPFAQLKYLRVTYDGLEDPLLGFLDVLHGRDLTVKGIATAHYFTVLIMTVVLVRLWWNQRKTSPGGTKHFLVSVLALMAITDLFFQNVLISRPVWDALRLTQVVQFSWRWNLLASVLAAVVFATVRDQRSRVWINLSVIGLALIASTAAIFHNFDVRVHPPLPQRTPFDPPEYAPVWANPSKDSVVAFALLHQDDAYAQDTSGRWLHESILARRPNDVRFSLTLEKPTTVVLHHWYWPAWKIYDAATGHEIPERPRPDGRESFLMPAGYHALDYQLETTDSERAGAILSLAALVAILMTALLLGMLHRKKPIATTRSPAEKAGTRSGPSIIKSSVTRS